METIISNIYNLMNNCNNNEKIDKNNNCVIDVYKEVKEGNTYINDKIIKRYAINKKIEMDIV